MTGLMTEAGEPRARSASDHSTARGEDRPPTDTELVAASVAGELDAWDTLVGRYGRLIYSIGIREGLDEEESGDVVESTFLALLDAGESHQVGDRPASWLVSMARQEVGRVQRGRVHRQDFTARPSPAAEPLTESHRIELVVSPEWDRVATLHQVLAQLPPHQRDIVDKSYLDHARPPVGTPLHRSAVASDANDHERSRALDRLRLQLTEENDL